jgi:hypothetical protein
MSYQPSEIADLILLLALGPMIIIGLRRVLPSVPRATYWALAAMLGGYIFTIAEGFVLADLFNMLEHICYAIAGVAFLVTALNLARMLGVPKAGEQ